MAGYESPGECQEVERVLMNEPFCVWKDVYQVGGAALSHQADCSVYLVDCGDLVLIDAGAGLSVRRLVANIESLGFDMNRLKVIIATHAHIDHVGSLWQLREKFGAQVIAHVLDAEAIETGAGVGAEFYGLSYRPCPVDAKLKGPEDTLKYGPHELKALHIPGHTPGSLAVYVDMGKRVLFGQDVHGPYFPPGADPLQAKTSLRKLLDLQAGILCEGHFGIFQPKDAVRKYIKGYLLSL